MKSDIIRRVEAGEKQSKVCADLDLNKQTVSNIIANKQKLEEVFEQNKLTGSRKKMRGASYDRLDEALSINGIRK